MSDLLGLYVVLSIQQFLVAACCFLLYQLGISNVWRIIKEIGQGYQRERQFVSQVPPSHPLAAQPQTLATAMLSKPQNNEKKPKEWQELMKESIDSPWLAHASDNKGIEPTNFVPVKTKTLDIT